ncbi:MAG: hypothetical protein ABIH23_08440, partial [bacterium]
MPAADIRMSVEVADQAQTDAAKPTFIDTQLDPVEKYALELVKTAHAYASEIINRDEHNKIEKYEKQYTGRGVQRRRNYNGQADLWPNISFEVVDTLLPQLVKLLFPNRDFFETEPQTKDLGEQAALAKDLLLQDIEDMTFLGKMLRAMRSNLKYGTVIVQTYWNYKKGYLRQPKAGLVEKVLQDHSDVEVLNPLDWYFGDVDKLDIQDMDFCGKTFNSTFTQLKAQKATDESGFYYNLDLVEKSSSSPGGDDKTKTVFSQRDKMLGKDVACAEYWFAPGIFDPTVDPEIADNPQILADFAEKYRCEPNDFLGGWVVTVADDAVPIRIQPNPHLDQEFPFVVGRCFELDNHAWGWGLLELIESDQFEFADLHNQAIDAISKKLTPPTFTIEGAIRNKDKKASFAPGANTEIDGQGFDIDKVFREFQTTANPQQAWAAAAELLMSVQRRTGSISSFAGVAGAKAGETATEVQNRSQGGASRVELRVFEMEENFVKPLLMKLYRLNQSFMDKPKAIRKVGEKGLNWVTVNPEDIVSAVKINMLGSKSVAN